jgi:hypothetical protein
MFVDLLKLTISILADCVLGSNRYPTCSSNLLPNLARLPNASSVADQSTGTSIDRDDKAYGESIGTMSIGTMFPTRRLS